MHTAYVHRFRMIKLPHRRNSDARFTFKMPFLSFAKETRNSQSRRRFTTGVGRDRHGTLLDVVSIVRAHKFAREFVESTVLCVYICIMYMYVY